MIRTINGFRGDHITINSEQIQLLDNPQVATHFMNFLPDDTRLMFKDISWYNKNKNEHKTITASQKWNNTSMDPENIVIFGTAMVGALGRILRIAPRTNRGFFTDYPTIKLNDCEEGVSHFYYYPLDSIEEIYITKESLRNADERFSKIVEYIYRPYP